MYIFVNIFSKQVLKNVRFYHANNKAELYKRCFTILGVPEQSDQNAVRSAYLALVKKYHPDSGHPEACVDKFTDVDNAFRILQKRYSKMRHGVEDQEEYEPPDIRHTAPQHRQYLSFDGIGIGTPSQRQKQYVAVKAVRAQERVTDYRVQKHQASEGAVMQKGGYFKKHAIKTKYGFDRVVEDLIQEAMSKGDFNNLAGTGKPLPNIQSQNPYVDFVQHKINKILLDNGFTPEWIMLQKDIRTDIEDLKQTLINERAFVGALPLNSSDERHWNAILTKNETRVTRINKMIEKFNLIVPILNNQMVRFDIQRLSNKILTEQPAGESSLERPQSEEPMKSKAAVDQKGFMSFLASLI